MHWRGNLGTWRLCPRTAEVAVLQPLARLQVAGSWPVLRRGARGLETRFSAVNGVGKDPEEASGAVWVATCAARGGHGDRGGRGRGRATCQIEFKPITDVLPSVARETCDASSEAWLCLCLAGPVHRYEFA